VSREATQPSGSVARTVSVVNQKGGVGKTTTVVNLGACLGALGKRVLVIDADPQGNATTGLGVTRGSLEASLADVVLEGMPAGDAVVRTATPNLWIVPSTIDLAPAEIRLVSVFSRERQLLRAVEALRGGYDYVLIDSPPSLGLLTVNCLVAAEGVIVPIQCEYYALEGLTQLREVLDMVRAEANPSLRMEGLLLTMFDSRVRISQEVAEDVRRHFPGNVFRTVIPRNVRLSEAPSHGMPVISYSPESRGAQAYTDLAREVLENEEKRSGTWVERPDTGGAAG